MEGNGQKTGHCCAVEAALAVIGGKWKPVLLWILAGGTRRFSAIRHAVPGITQAMLTKQLRELEQDELIVRTVYAEVPPRVEYSLSEFGRTALPVIESLCTWGEVYLSTRENQATGSREKKTGTRIMAEEQDEEP
jgi:DNA-binding HxlR family transcriptional regulator